MKKSLLVLVIALCFLMGCSKKNQTEEDKVQQSSANTQTEISFNGSSTLAPVITEIANKLQQDYKTWDKIDSSLSKDDISIVVSSAGSGAGVKSVLDDTANFGMLARGIKDEEKQALGNFKEIKLGTDALTISVNPQNEILKLKNNLTKDELIKIFSGEYKKWSDLDPSLPQEDIVVVIRDLSGGAHEVFQKKVMGDTKVTDNAVIAPSMGALVQKIIENKNAIGYASYGIVNQHKNELSPLKVDGIEPTKENILSGTYYISRPLIVVHKEQTTKEEDKLIELLKTDLGQNIVEKMGFVPEQ